MVSYTIHELVNHHEDMVEWEKRSREILGDSPRFEARKRFSFFSLFKSSGKNHRGGDAPSGD